MLRAGLVGLFALVLGCARHTPPDGPPVARAFYFWRTTFALSPAETRAVADLGITRLYVRMFDVAWSEAERRAVPMGPLVVPAGARLPAGVELVPVVFLRDEVLRHAAAGPLAGEIWGEVSRRTAALGSAPRELQLDCDWTDHTRDAYFALLRAVRQAGHVSLSATIRLHQIKYRERTGVPPIDRGMLMFYNMGKFSADPDARAIFDADSAARYLARVGEYPLPLDLALPIWSWTVHVRDGAAPGHVRRAPRRALVQACLRADEEQGAQGQGRVPGGEGRARRPDRHAAAGRRHPGPPGPGDVVRQAEAAVGHQVLQGGAEGVRDVPRLGGRAGPVACPARGPQRGVWV